MQTAHGTAALPWRQNDSGKRQLATAEQWRRPLSAGDKARGRGVGASKQVRP